MAGYPDPLLFAPQDPTRVGVPYFAVNNNQNGYQLVSRFWDGHIAKKFNRETKTNNYYNSGFDQRSLGTFSNRPYQYTEDVIRSYNRTAADAIGYTTNVSSSGQSFGGMNADGPNDYHRPNFTGIHDVPKRVAHGDGGANRIPKRADPELESYTPQYETARTKSWSNQYGILYQGPSSGKFRTSKPVIEYEDPSELYGRFLAKGFVARASSAHDAFVYKDPYALQFTPYSNPNYTM